MPYNKNLQRAYSNFQTIPVLEKRSWGISTTPRTGPVTPLSVDTRAIPQKHGCLPSPRLSDGLSGRRRHRGLIRITCTFIRKSPVPVAWPYAELGYRILRACLHSRMSSSHFGFKKPTWTLSALPVPRDTDKTSKGKNSSKVGPFLGCTYCSRQSKETLRKLPCTSQRKFKQQFSGGCFVLKLLSHEKTSFLEYSSKSFPTSPWLSLCNWEFQRKLGVTQSVSVQEVSLGKGWHKKVTTLCTQIPELPGPNLSVC